MRHAAGITVPTVVAGPEKGRASDSLSTTVAIPQTGAAVRGVAILIASAQSDFEVSRVDFAIAGEAGVRIRVGARDTQYA
jgi:hypothetical protein